MRPRWRSWTGDVPTCAAHGGKSLRKIEVNARLIAAQPAIALEQHKRREEYFNS